MSADDLEENMGKWERWDRARWARWEGGGRWWDIVSVVILKGEPAQHRAQRRGAATCVCFPAGVFEYGSIDREAPPS